MLEPAILHKEEITKAFGRILYTEKYLWYTGSIDNYEWEIKEEADKFQFAIVDYNYGTKEVIGFISFRIDWYCSCAYNFGLIKFDNNSDGVKFDRLRTTRKMTSAVREVIKMIKGFNLHRIDFRCVGGNPAGKKYFKLLSVFNKDYLTRAVTFFDNIKDRKGDYHDTIMFELIQR